MPISNQDGTFNVPSIMRRMHKEVDLTVQLCALDMKETLERTNPIDVSSRADDYVSSEEWQVALGSYAGSVLSSSTGKGGLSGSVGGAAMDIAVNSGKFRKQTTQGDNIDDYNSEKHVSITIYNPAPYMARLNRGWSPQAPAGWIEQCIDEVTSRWGV